MLLVGLPPPVVEEMLRQRNGAGYLPLHLICANGYRDGAR